MQKTVNKGAVRRRRSGGLKAKQNRAGYIFILPIILGMLVLFIPMIFRTLQFSVNEVNITPDGYKLTFIGLQSYIKLMTQDTWFLTTSYTTLGNMLVDLVCIMIFSFFVAVLLNQNFHGRTLARIIFFLPVVISAGIILQVENGDILMSTIQQQTAADTGEITKSGMMSLYDILVNTALPMPVVSVITNVIGRLYNVLISSGVQILIYLSGLQSISPSLYEAATVEGSTGWETFWKITFPMISPMIFVNGVYTFIDSANKTTNPIMNQVLYETMSGNYDYASAMAMIFMAAVAVIMAVIFIPSRRLVFYQT